VMYRCPGSHRDIPGLICLSAEKVNATFRSSSYSGRNHGRAFRNEACVSSDGLARMRFTRWSLFWWAEHHGESSCRLSADHGQRMWVLVVLLTQLINFNTELPSSAGRFLGVVIMRKRGYKLPEQSDLILQPT
jgi:hypothetical protein